MSARFAIQITPELKRFRDFGANALTPLVKHIAHRLFNWDLRLPACGVAQAAVIAGHNRNLDRAESIRFNADFDGHFAVTNQGLQNGLHRVSLSAAYVIDFTRNTMDKQSGIGPNHFTYLSKITRCGKVAHINYC